MRATAVSHTAGSQEAGEDLVLQPCSPKHTHTTLCGETRESEADTSMIGWKTGSQGSRYLPHVT